MSNVKAGGLLLTLLVIATYLGFTKDIPFVNEPYEIKAAFMDSVGINKNSPVRIAGVEVGKVRSVQHTSPGSRTTTVTMSIIDKGRPVHMDATAKIRPRIFLEGNFYVDLHPGTPGAPEMRAGATIPTDRTANPVQFDEVLAALKTDTRAKLRRVLMELGDAEKAGAGRAFNQSLQYQADAYKYSAIVSEAMLGERPGDLARFLRGSGQVAEAFDRSPAQLRSLITDFNRTAGAFASRQAQLRAAVHELPTTLREGMPTFAALNAAFPDVRRFAGAARPGVRSTGPAVNALLPALRQLRGAVGPNELRGLSSDLRASTPSLTSLAQDTVPVLGELRELASCATNVMVPWGDLRVPDRMFPASGPVHQEFAKAQSGLAGESRSFDANSMWFKVLGQGGPQTFDLGGGLFGTGSSNMGVNPPPDTTRPPLRPDVPCETQDVPDLRTNPQGGPRQVNTSGSPAQQRLVQERTDMARQTALAVAKQQLRAAGDTKTPVIDSQASEDLIKQIAAQRGLSDQLEQLPDRVDQVNQVVRRR